MERGQDLAALGGQPLAPLDVIAGAKMGAIAAFFCRQCTVGIIKKGIGVKIEDGLSISQCCCFGIEGIKDGIVDDSIVIGPCLGDMEVAHEDQQSIGLGGADLLCQGGIFLHGADWRDSPHR